MQLSAWVTPIQSIVFVVLAIIQTQIGLQGGNSAGLRVCGTRCARMSESEVNSMRVAPGMYIGLSVACFGLLCSATTSDVRSLCWTLLVPAVSVSCFADSSEIHWTVCTFHDIDNSFHILRTISCRWLLYPYFRTQSLIVSMPGALLYRKARKAQSLCPHKFS